jgi:drug/metabolite transporter (DMT)-like permease
MEGDVGRLALCVLFLNPVLWASFYAITKQSLESVDPLVFAVAELSIAALPALSLLIVLNRLVTVRTVKAGAILGAVLLVAVLASTFALYYTTATNTAFFPALNGSLAAIFTVTVLRQPIGRRTQIATVFATSGALLIILFSVQGGGNTIGDAIALGAAAAYTVYIFCVDSQLGVQNGYSVAELVTIGSIEIVVMACLSWVLFLGLGLDVNSLNFGRDDAMSALYVGLFTTFAPTLIAALFQRYVAPLTVALLYVLEPVWGALAANLIDNEAIAFSGYVGGALIVIASIMNIVAQVAPDQKAGESQRLIQ